MFKTCIHFVSIDMRRILLEAINSFCSKSVPGIHFVSIDMRTGKKHNLVAMLFGCVASWNATGWMDVPLQNALQTPPPTPPLGPRYIVLRGRDGLLFCCVPLCVWCVSMCVRACVRAEQPPGAVGIA